MGPLWSTFCFWAWNKRSRGRARHVSHRIAFGHCKACTGKRCGLALSCTGLCFLVADIVWVLAAVASAMGLSKADS